MHQEARHRPLALALPLAIQKAAKDAFAAGTLCPKEKVRLRVVYPEELHYVHVPPRGRLAKHMTSIMQFMLFRPFKPSMKKDGAEGAIA